MDKLKYYGGDMESNNRLLSKMDEFVYAINALVEEVALLKKQREEDKMFEEICSVYVKGE